MARTVRSITIDRQETALARISDLAGAAAVLLDRLTSRPDPNVEIQAANLEELTVILLAAHDLRLLLIAERSHNAERHP